MGSLKLFTDPAKRPTTTVSVRVDPETGARTATEDDSALLVFRLRRLTSYDLETITEACTEITIAGDDKPEVKTDGMKLNRMRIIAAVTSVDGLEVDGKPATSMSLDVYKLLDPSVTNCLLETVREMAGGGQSDDTENFEESPEHG